jgi:glycosyltransferase involved in cell wall biosynthesis
MRALCENPALRTRLAERAAQTAARFTWDENGERFREMFSAILRDKSKAKP